MRTRTLVYPAALAAALIALPAPAAAQDGLASRLDRLLAAPPFARAHWGVLVLDERGRTVYARNADHLFVPASNTKLVVAAVASALLPPDYRPSVSLYGTGPVENGVLHGDLVAYGRGDPMFSQRCYGPDTLAVGTCDSLWTRMDAMADSLIAKGVRQVRGAVVGDGSYFEPRTVHEAWESYDLNWWYAAPVSGLGFNENSVDITWASGATEHAPADITLAPDVGLFRFENRTFTGPADVGRTLDFFRTPGTWLILAEGSVPLGARAHREYFAVPDPNRYFAAALRAALARHGVAVEGPTQSTVDSTTFRAARQGAPLVTSYGRPLADYLFPILNSSQNWFAEMLLKTLGRTVADTGSWDAALALEQRFLMDSVGADSTSFALMDGSGLASGNLITPRTLVAILRYMRAHPRGAGFLRALPRSGQAGSLASRFVGTALEGRVLAKTGSINRVNTLSGYVERPHGRVWTFSVMMNDRTGRYGEALARIDSVVVAVTGR